MGLRLFVNVAAMGNPRYIDGLGRVVNLVNNAVVTYPNPPFVIAAL